MTQGNKRTKMGFRKINSEINWVTAQIAVGAYPDQERIEDLAQNGINQILNVCEVKNVDIKQDWDIEIEHYPIRDGFLIPTEDAINLVQLLHQYIDSGRKVYVHCAAGQHRSPTVIWLYLISTGLSLAKAGELISNASVDAVPGHPHLFNMDLIRTIQERFKKEEND